MDTFRVYYSGACFERGDSPEQVEKKVQDNERDFTTWNLLGDLYMNHHARAQAVDFSDGYYLGSSVALAAADSKIDTIKTPRDFAGMKVGVQRGTVYEHWAQTNLVDSKLIRKRDLRVYTDISQAVNDLQKTLKGIFH